MKVVNKEPKYDLGKKILGNYEAREAKTCKQSLIKNNKKTSVLKERKDKRKFWSVNQDVVPGPASLVDKAVA